MDVAVRPPARAARAGPREDSVGVSQGRSLENPASGSRASHPISRDTQNTRRASRAWRAPVAFVRAWLTLHAFVALALLGAAQGVDESAALERAFPHAALEKRLVVFTAKERETLSAAANPFEAPRTFRCWIAREEGALRGYAVIGDAPGKCQPITYLLRVDAQLAIEAVEILAYRESHGGEVREERWRAQFTGKDVRSELRLSRDIRNVAGATISCRSITDAVRRDLACLALVHATKPAPATAPAAVEASIERASSAQPVAGAAPAARCRLLMGTTLSIEVDAADADRAAAAVEAAFAEVARLEAILSDWSETSELARFHRVESGAWFDASAELAELVTRSKEISHASHGAFDPSVGALVRVWRAAFAHASFPPAAELDSALATRGIDALEQLNGARPGLRSVRAGLRLDFGAIGKGYALERAARELESRGVTRALLSFGGQLLALDPPRGTSGWRVAIAHPARPGDVLETRSLARVSLSTSGDQERGRIVDGRRVSHIVDPRDGRPVEGMLAAIVEHPRAADADAWSTALYVLGARDGAALARERGLDCILWPTEGEPVRLGAFAAPGNAAVAPASPKAAISPSDAPGSGTAADRVTANGTDAKNEIAREPLDAGGPR